MRVWVTGGGGFIGAELTRQIVTAGHDVSIVQRSPELPASLAALGGQSCRVVTLDLGDRTALRAKLERGRPELVFHLAWYTDPRDYLHSDANLDSLVATAALMRELAALGNVKIVGAGTCLEYADTGAPRRETDATDPRSLYASCKLGAWYLIRALSEQSGLACAWGRIFHLHGPGESPRRLIPWVASELRAGRPIDLTDGLQVRDHLHVHDVAAALALLGSSEATGVVNICSGQAVRLREVLEVVADLFGKRDQLRFGVLPHRAGEVEYLAGDNACLRRLGWRPRFDLRVGLADALSEGAGIPQDPQPIKDSQS